MSVRIVYSVLGGLALALGLVVLWLNAYGGFAKSDRLCEAGFCDAEVLLGAARITSLVEGVQETKLPVRLHAAMLRRDAASPFTWANTGFAYLEAGDRARARYCAARALELGSGSAPLAMRVLHLYLADGSRDDVLRTGKALLGHVRDYDDFVFRYYDSLEAPNASVLELGLPAQAEAASSWLRSRIAAGDAPAAAETWKWMQARSLVAEPSVNWYTAFLMQQKAVEESRRIWDDFHAGKRARFPRNLIFNPQFDMPLSKGPYDWRIDALPGAAVEFDRAARDGRGALKIAFQGEGNLDFHHVGQIVPVSRRPLRLKAAVKAEGLTTNEGVAIRVWDREAPARFSFVTAQLTGTSDWQQWDYPLSVPAGTQLLEVRIVRQRSQKFDNKIRGAAWFSDITLEEARP